ncbi:Hypothetical protein, predicted lipoprotein [Metamycoplasma alkalescens 14918]|uniref:Lipoprotein n=2 Tax=Metamycoplasma alkalescens TaxID=45363 RepID=N9U0J8_9BACT|nr:Hypothetical protein, predicted lipoprotein [Metamycoplasma alkalescens 14918]
MKKLNKMSFLFFATLSLGSLPLIAASCENVSKKRFRNDKNLANDLESNKEDSSFSSSNEQKNDDLSKKKIQTKDSNKNDESISNNEKPKTHDDLDSNKEENIPKKEMVNDHNPLLNIAKDDEKSNIENQKLKISKISVEEKINQSLKKVEANNEEIKNILKNIEKEKNNLDLDFLVSIIDHSFDEFETILNLKNIENLEEFKKQIEEIKEKLSDLLELFFEFKNNYSKIEKEIGDLKEKINKLANLFKNNDLKLKFEVFNYFINQIFDCILKRISNLKLHLQKYSELSSKRNQLVKEISSYSNSFWHGWNLFFYPGSYGQKYNSLINESNKLKNQIDSEINNIDKFDFLK